MARRFHATPMDFEYQNGTGPIDNRSPFAQVSSNAQRFPPMTPNKRSQSAYDTPYKTPYTTAGASRRPSPTKPLPPNPPAFNALFSTPRKVNMDMEDSSAGETPKSPERDGDSEAGTPVERMPWNRQLKSAPVVPTRGILAEGGSPVKEREMDVRRDKETSNGRFGQWMKKAFSPGRGEIPRVDKDRRVRKVKSREAHKHSMALQKRADNTGPGSEADDDASELPMERIRSPKKSSNNTQSQQPPPQDSAPPPYSTPPPRGPNPISAFFTFIGQHPTVPHILTFYAQLFFNIFLLAFCAYLLYTFCAAIQGDINKKAFEASADIIAEMAVCADHFTLNDCGLSRRAPALEGLCNNWKKCMNQDATKVARAQVSASTFAEIYNSLIEPISYKAMLFTLLLVFGCFGISNFAFGVLRHKTAEQQQWSGAGPYAYQPPPPTPQRQFSGQEGGFYAGTPWTGAPALGYEPAPSGGYGRIPGRDSPVKRLDF